MAGFHDGLNLMEKLRISQSKKLELIPLPDSELTLCWSVWSISQCITVVLPRFWWYLVMFHSFQWITDTNIRRAFWCIFAAFWLSDLCQLTEPRDWTFFGGTGSVAKWKMSRKASLVGAISRSNSFRMRLETFSTIFSHLCQIFPVWRFLSGTKPDAFIWSWKLPCCSLWWQFTPAAQFFAYFADVGAVKFAITMESIIRDRNDAMTLLWLMTWKNTSEKLMMHDMFWQVMDCSHAARYILLSWHMRWPSIPV